MSLPISASSDDPEACSGTGVIVSHQPSLNDILSKSSLPTTICVILDDLFNDEEARKLADALISLASKVDVSRLSLVIVCNCSRRISSIVADGLHALRGLKDIALVLTENSGPASVLAREMALSVQHTQKVDKTDSLTKLPRELLHDILDRVFNDEHNQEVFINEDTYCWYTGIECCEECLPAKMISDGECACQQLVGGFSTTCTCGRSRTALFRTSKSLLVNSLHVFISTNRFRLYGLRPAKKFLRSLSRDSLQAIKKLDIHFKYLDYELHTQHILEQLVEIVNIIKSKCNLNGMYLSLFHGSNYTGPGPIPKQILDLDKQMRKTIVDVLKPLKEGGLDGLEIYGWGYWVSKPKVIRSGWQ